MCLNQRVEPVERAGDAFGEPFGELPGRVPRVLVFLHLPEDGADDGRRELADFALIQHLERGLAPSAPRRPPAGGRLTHGRSPSSRAR